MSFDAFGLIDSTLEQELALQGFGESQPLEAEEGRAAMYATDEVAYSLLYDKKRQRFVLRSTTLTEDKKPGDWRNLSLWLYDELEGTRADAESIQNDFLDVVRGPKRVAVVQQKKKRGKNEDRAVDPLFFCNRLAGIFPELKEDMKNERIVYGQIRFITFIRENVVGKVEDLVCSYPDSDPCTKLCTLFDDMYKDGDMDVRSILTAVVLNGVNDDTFDMLQERLGEELQKAAKFSRKLKGKNIKPEKKKKAKKVVAKLEN